ncbi:MAG TPA: hypothetical protein VF570_14310, partial [Pyrinomonadaceae bacterium]
AKSGRGLFHFVADAQDISKVFLKEFQSLVSPVASEPDVEVTFGPGLELAQVYGYEPREREGSVSVKLDNMNSGLTQVLLLRFRVTRAGADAARLPVNVRLGYYDIERRARVDKTQEAALTPSAGRGAEEMLRDPEVGKNYAIAQLAQAIRDMAAAVESGRFKDAEHLLNAAVAGTYQRYPHLEDEDISRTLLVAQKYQELVRKYNQERQQGRK